MALLKTRSLREMMRSGTPWALACCCAFGLVSSGLGQANEVSQLIGQLKYSDPETRRNAAQSLGEIGDRRAVEPVIDALADTGSSVKESVAFALGDICDLRAVEPLIAALKDPDPRVRRSAIRALMEIKDARAVDPIHAALADPDAHVRQAAVEGLIGINSSAPVPHLTDSSNAQARPDLLKPQMDSRLSEVERLAAIRVPTATPSDADPQTRGGTAFTDGEVKDAGITESLPQGVYARIYFYQPIEKVQHHSHHPARVGPIPSIRWNGGMLPKLQEGTYAAYEVALPAPHPLVFTNQYMGRDVTTTGCALPGCVLTYHYGPPRLMTQVVCQVQLEAGRNYYIKYVKFGGGILPMKEKYGAKEMEGLRRLSQSPSIDTSHAP